MSRPEPKYSCKLKNCPRCFYSISNLRKHLIQGHNISRPQTEQLLEEWDYLKQVEDLKTKITNSDLRKILSL